MRFKQMGRKGDHRLNIPLLSGGINADVDSTLIADDELVSCVNMELRDGALRTRKALRAEGGEFCSFDLGGDYFHSSMDCVCRTPFKIGGKTYAVTVSAVRGNTYNNYKLYIDLVPLSENDDGKEVIRYEMPIPKSEFQPVAVAPCDASRYKTPFLVFYDNSVYRKDGDQFVPIPEEELYAPLVMINGESALYDSGKHKANGVMFEGFNVLTRRYRATFTSSVQDANLVDCEVYVMPTKMDDSKPVKMEITTRYGIRDITIPITTEELKEGYDFEIGGNKHTVYATDNKIVVKPPIPASTVSGNVTVTAVAADEENRHGSVAGATVAVWFGGTQNRNGGTRLFLTGFESVEGKGACMMWSDVDNPLYFPENNYMYVGDPSQRITTLSKQEDMLVVFKEREMYYVRYVEGSVDAESVVEGTNVDVTVSAAYFPLTQLSPVVGCDVPDTVTLCRNRLVWMNRNGRVYTLRTANAYSERNVREIGVKIRPRLLAVTTVEERKRACAMDFEGRYVLMIGYKAFAFDYADSGFVHQSSYNSDKRASQNMAWYEHHFDQLPTGYGEGSGYGVLKAVSDGGDKAVLIVTRNTPAVFCCRTRWYFEEDECDNRITEGGAIQDVPIESSFVTKSYSFGNASVAKRVKALFMNIDTDNAHLRMTVDGKEDHAVRRLRGDGERMQLVLPGVKHCQTIGFSLEARVPVAVKSLQLQYQNLDVIR